MKLSLGRFRKIYDMAVIGAGPAGISAAITGKVRMKNVVVFEAGKPMDKIRKAREIRNYPGFGITSGEEICRAFLEHAEELGVEIRKEKVTGITKSGNFSIYTEKGMVAAKSVILAVGLIKEKSYPGEEELLGRGVSYCITCDGAAFRGGVVAVIAESEKGEEEARALINDYGCTVKYIPLYKMKSERGFHEIIRSEPLALRASANGVEVEFKDASLEVDGVFLIKRFSSPARLIDGLKMEGRHVKVNRNMETSIPGVFAAGDCTGPPYQIAKVTGEGQVAALQAVKYISRIISRVEREGEVET